MTTGQFLNLFVLAAIQRGTSQRLAREPEPEIMRDRQQVEDYDAAGDSTLGFLYCLAIELMNLAMPGAGRPHVHLDLGCGTAKFTARVAEVFRPSKIIAVDGSAEMLHHAASNLKRLGPSVDVELRLGQITELGEFAAGSVDLATCSLTLHHLPDIEHVARLLQEMGRVTKPGGLVFLLDLSRLKTRRLIERYVELFSAGNSRLHNRDFFNSMCAAFTPEELRAAMVSEEGADGTMWFHFTAPVLPTLQVMMRVPAGQRPRDSRVWRQSPIGYVGNLEWRFVREQFCRKCIKSWTWHARRNGRAECNY